MAQEKPLSNAEWSDLLKIIGRRLQRDMLPLVTLAGIDDALTEAYLETQAAFEDGRVEKAGILGYLFVCARRVILDDQVNAGLANAFTVPLLIEQFQLVHREYNETQEVELYVDPGDATKEEVRAVLRAVNNLHVAAGGLGLEFRVDGLYVKARQEALV